MPSSDERVGPVGSSPAATPSLYAAAWSAARAGNAGARLDAQIRLADAQLHAREFHAALANYKFAERLAAAIDPDSGQYWIVRASIAQALRRTHHIQEAREECATIRARLAHQPIAGKPGVGRLIWRMTGSLEATLDSTIGHFAAAAATAALLAEELFADGDGARAADQGYNAALWGFFAAEQAGAGWKVPYDRACDFARRSRERASAAGLGCESKVEQSLLQVFAELMGIKLLLREASHAEAEPRLAVAAGELAQICATDLPTPCLRLEAALLRLRLTERAGAAPEQAAARHAILDLMRVERPLAALWVRQDLCARFHWDRDVIPLGRPDPDLERFLKEADV